jgi:transcriptional regulator of acetoin/glycerol metabolism
VPENRTATYPSDQRGYLGGSDQPAALRIYGTPHELPLLAGQLVFQLGREGDLRADHEYLSARHLLIERQGNDLRLENISQNRKNALVFENREVATYCLVRPGDTFKIGNTIYYVLNEEMRMARRKVAQILGFTNDKAVDDCLIIAAKDADRHVVLFGGIGSGQKSLANAIHQCSTRRRSNCISVPAASEPGSADPQRIEDAKDGTLVIELPKDRKFDQLFVDRLTAPGVRVRLVICLEAAGKLAKSFQPLVTRNADTIEIPRIQDRKDELPVILDDWFVEHRSSLRFRDLAADVQSKLRSYRWRENLQELLQAAFHLTVLAQYASEREAERDQTFTRSKSRYWRAKMRLPLPIVPKKTLETASHKKVRR